MNFTKTLADYAIRVNYDDLPFEVIQQVKALTLQVLGVSIAGCQTEQGREAIALAKRLGSGKAEAIILGDGNKISCVEAGFANGTLADVLDWEDCSPTGHPSAGIIPSALAAAEMKNSSGKDFITAVAAGYEVYQRIALAVQPKDEYRFKTGWGITAWQIFGAVISAAKLFELNANQISKAIGIAASFSPIVNRKINPDSRSDIYHYLHGSTCRDGILSALIAQSNAYFPDDILDGETGYWVSVSDKCDWGKMVQNLGKEYLIMDTLFKYWPANMWIQQPLDILDSLIKEHGLKPEDISQILVKPNIKSRMTHRQDGYLGLVDAEFSIPFCLASLLIDNRPGPNWYTKERLKDKNLLDLASKVKTEGEELLPWQAFKMFQSDKYPEFLLDIFTQNGSHFKKSLSYPKGHPKNRLTMDEHKERFRLESENILHLVKIEEIIEMVANLEKLGNITNLTKLLNPSF